MRSIMTLRTGDRQDRTSARDRRYRCCFERWTVLNIFTQRCRQFGFEFLEGWLYFDEGSDDSTSPAEGWVLLVLRFSPSNSYFTWETSIKIAQDASIKVLTDFRLACVGVAWTNGDFRGFQILDSNFYILPHYTPSRDCSCLLVQNSFTMIYVCIYDTGSVPGIRLTHIFRLTRIAPESQTGSIPAFILIHKKYVRVLRPMINNIVRSANYELTLLG